MARFFKLPDNEGNGDDKVFVGCCFKDGMVLKPTSLDRGARKGSLDILLWYWICVWENEANPF
jgi:hypothetical protein